MTVHSLRIIPLRVLAVLWASPYTLLGSVLGVGGIFTGGNARMRGRDIEFYGGGVKWLLNRLPGSVNFSRSP